MTDNRGSPQRSSGPRRTSQQVTQVSNGSEHFTTSATSLILRLPCRMQMLSGGDGRWTWMSGKGVAPPRNRIGSSIQLLQGANPFREIIL